MSLKLKGRKVWFYVENRHGGKTKMKGKISDHYPISIKVELPSGAITSVLEKDLYFAGREPVEKKKTDKKKG